MTEPSLAIQKTIRTRLVAEPTVTALVPADNILDRNHRPERFPLIGIGESTAIFADDLDTFHDRVFADVHIWTLEDGLFGVKSIASAIRAALYRRPWTIDGFRCMALRVVSARFMRDPDGEHGHAVVTIDAILKRVA